MAKAKMNGFRTDPNKLFRTEVWLTAGQRLRLDMEMTKRYNTEANLDPVTGDPIILSRSYLIRELIDQSDFIEPGRLTETPAERRTRIRTEKRNRIRRKRGLPLD